jgi:hypothetical protein
LTGVRVSALLAHGLIQSAQPNAEPRSGFLAAPLVGKLADLGELGYQRLASIRRRAWCRAAFVQAIFHQQELTQPLPTTPIEELDGVLPPARQDRKHCLV